MRHFLCEINDSKCIQGDSFIILKDFILYIRSCFVLFLFGFLQYSAISFIFRFSNAFKDKK